MAKYKAYSEYKSSRVNYLGDIPKEWKLIKFGLTNSSAELGGNYLASEGEQGIAVIKMGNLGRGVVNLAKIERIPLNEKYDTHHLLKAGDFLFNTRNSLELVGKVSVWREELEHAIYNSNILRITFDKKFVDSTDFISYLFNSDRALSQLRLIAKGTTSVAAIYYKDLSSLVFAFPPVREQTQIANFLDFETAQIDTLIDKQQTLIQLLKEKRQAVISHAVTKGLNPDAPMKNSGVEWLGEVPEHWEVKRIKHYGKIIGGFAFKSEDFIDSGYPVLKISNVSHLTLSFDDESFLPLSFVERHSEYKVEENDLVFAMTRPIISGGIKVAKIPKLDLMPLVNQRVGFLKLKSELLADFILYSSLSSSFKAQFKNNMTITNQPNISGEGIESVAFPMPPKNELIKIVDFLNSSEGVFQNLSIKSEQQVELLKERRTALISAAVTGKIDVRGWVAPTTNS